MAPSDSDSSGKGFWLIPDDLDVTGKLQEKLTIARQEDDLQMLKTGDFSDCVVFCGNKKWKAHKTILSRCLYFDRAFSSDNSFKDARESQIRIRDFEPFEIDWLLEFIYGKRINAEHAKSDSPNKSVLETCILLWSMGDYFCMPDLCESALSQLKSRCKVFLLRSRHLSTMLKEIAFLPALEAGIRAAWRHDMVAVPGRKDLISLYVGIHPFVKDHPSFICLLDEFPEFTAQFLKALLGCPGLQSIESRILLETQCHICRGHVMFNSKGIHVRNEEAFVWTPTSRDFWNNSTYLCCSQKCYNSVVNRLVLPGLTEKSSKSPGKEYQDRARHNTEIIQKAIDDTATNKAASGSKAVSEGKAASGRYQDQQAQIVSLMLTGLTQQQAEELVGDISGLVDPSGNKIHKPAVAGPSQD